jgi:hypothetical protein
MSFGSVEELKGFRMECGCIVEWSDGKDEEHEVVDSFIGKEIRLLKLLHPLGFTLDPYS